MTDGQLGPARRRAARSRHELHARARRDRVHPSVRSVRRDSVRRSEGAVPRASSPRSTRPSSACSRAAQFTLGSEVAAFEEEFAAYCGATHGIGVNTGTSALHLALLAAGVGPGDEVITVPFTFVATVVGDRLHRRDAGVRRHRSADLHDGPGRDRGGDHAAHQGDHAGAPLRPAGRHGPDPGDRPPARPRRHRGRGQAHGAEYKGRRAGSLGDMALLQLLPRQEPRRVRRGRHGRRPTTRSTRRRSACCATGAPRRSTTTC